MAALRLSDGTPTDGDLLGLWRDDPAAVAFDGQGAQVWRADLPVDTALARNRLVACGARLQRSHAQLSEAAAQLGADMDRHRHGSAETPIVPVMGELVVWPQGSGELEAPELSGDLAFTGGGQAAQWWRETSRDLADIAGRVARACSPTLLIETSVGGELVGRSLVGLRGDVRTAWGSGRGQEDALLHEATVALALSTRATVLRMVAVVARAASAIALRLALPGGPLLALPVAWRSIQRVLNEMNGALGERETRW